MNNFEAILKRIPVKTWQRLGINEAGAVFSMPEGKSFGSGNADIRVSEQVIVEPGFAAPAPEEDAAAFFVPEKMGRFIDEHSNIRYCIRIPKGHKEEKPILIELSMDSREPVLIDDVVIIAEEGSAASIVIKYISEGGAAVRHSGRTRVILRRNAKVKLVKIQMLGGQSGHFDAVGGFVEERAQLDVILAELGAGKPFSSCNLVLAGEGGGANLDVVYLGDGRRTLDMSYRAEHRGRETVSHICAKGILLAQSRKVLRDTLDFVSGASGSKGREEESVLVLSPKVKNVSVPLLLCGEDDVEGEHAVTSGSPDEEVLFYLMSRGIGEADARILLAQAAVSSIVEKIPDEPIRRAVLGAVRRAVERGGRRN